jgi:hypothetical protein
MKFFVKGKIVKLEGLVGYLKDIGYESTNLTDDDFTLEIYTKGKKFGYRHPSEKGYDVEKDAKVIYNLLTHNTFCCKKTDVFGNTKYVETCTEDFDCNSELTTANENTFDTFSLEPSLQYFYKSPLEFTDLREWQLSSTDSNEGKKESKGKTDYVELDWDYIDAVADRMNSNKDKYPINNWKKRMDVKELAMSAIRHARKILQPVEGDKESLEEHAVALACNGMMINYQMK